MTLEIRSPPKNFNDIFKVGSTFQEKIKLFRKSDNKFRPSFSNNFKSSNIFAISNFAKSHFISSISYGGIPKLLIAGDSKY